MSKRNFCAKVWGETGGITESNATADDRRGGKNMCNDFNFAAKPFFSLIFDLLWCKVIRLKVVLSRQRLEARSRSFRHI